MSGSFLLVRHAESEWNAQGRWQGQANPPLSERGREQAERLAARLVGERADVLVSSDLRRARETAEALGRVLGLEPRVEPLLRELDVGRWSGLTREEIDTQDPKDLARFEAGDAAVRAGGAESRQAIRQRVRAVFQELARAHQGETVVVVTHLGVVRALLPGTELDNAEFVRTTPDEFASPDADFEADAPDDHGNSRAL